MHASNGILLIMSLQFARNFCTRKVTRAISRIALGMQDRVYLGNLSSKRDWGHAKDYIRAMHAILQQDEPDDYVIATGITTTIRDFIKMSATEIGLELTFKGEGADEKGREAWREVCYCLWRRRAQTRQSRAERHGEKGSRGKWE